MSKNHIFRIEKTKNYTVMSNYHLNDENLSWKAKGLHSYILSKPDDWKVIINQLINASTDGEVSTRSGIDELYKMRYWQKYPVYVDGVIRHWETIIYEAPCSPDEIIKSIAYSENEVIIKYENGEIQKKSTQTQQTQLLGGNLEVGFLEEENLEIENPGLLNTDSLLSTDSSNYSVSQSKISVDKKNPSKKKIDGRTDNHEQNFKQIEDKLDIKGLKQAYPQYNALIDEILLNIFDMYTNNYTTIQGQSKSQNMIRSAIAKLTYFHIEALLLKFVEVSKSTKIKNNKGYIQTMIYNIAFESHLSLKNDIEFNFS